MELSLVKSTTIIFHPTNGRTMDEAREDREPLRWPVFWSESGVVLRQTHHIFGCGTKKLYTQYGLSVRQSRIWATGQFGYAPIWADVDLSQTSRCAWLEILRPRPTWDKGYPALEISGRSCICTLYMYKTTNNPEIIPLLKQGVVFVKQNTPSQSQGNWMRVNWVNLLDHIRWQRPK